MPNIQLKRSLTTGSLPTTASLLEGEIAMNVPDGRIFLRKSGSGSDTIESVITTGARNSGSVQLTGSMSVSGSGDILTAQGDNIFFTGNLMEFSGDAFEMTGSLAVVGNTVMTGSLTVTQNITGNLIGTSSWAVSSSQAVSSSFATTASYYNIGFTPENVSNKENTTLDTSPTKYPTNRLVKEVTDLKLDKVSTAGVERAYIINADGSQGTKATSDFKDVLEFANLSAFPITGETGKIYLALDTNKIYRWSGSAYMEIGGVKAKFTIYKNFAINPMSDFTNWYRQVSDLAGFTANAGITNTNAFSGDTNRFPQSPIPFTFKIKNINVNLESNTAGLLTFDFAIRSFELPLGIVNSGLTTNSTNNKIIGRKSVQQTHGGGQPNYSFTGTEIDTTTILSANSYLKLYIKNNSGVSAGSVQGMVAITIEEV